MVINRENIEECLLLLVDGELEAATEAEVMAYVERHPEYEALLDAYLQTRLEDETIVFEDKESLLRPETQVLPLKRNRKPLALAAGLLFLAGLGWWLKAITNKTEELPAVAVTKPSGPKSDYTSVPDPQQAISPAAKPVVTVAAPPPALQTRDTLDLAMVTAPETRAHQEALQLLPAADYSLPVPDRTPGAVPLNVPSSLPADSREPAEEMKNWSLINPDKFEVIDALIAQAETLKSEVQEKAKTLRVSTIAIRLGGKEFTIIK